jgi:DNA repair protein RadA/Sms
MAKTKTVFYCSNCGASAARWLGKCPSCGEWNTFQEEVVKRDESLSIPWKSASGTVLKSAPRLLTAANDEQAEARISMADNELNRVLGGGLVPGSLVLLGGEPGIGKSTLMLQVLMQLRDLKVLYVSGEESHNQVAMRAKRIGTAGEHLYLLTETSTQEIFRHIQQLQPQLVLVDSVQTLQSALLDATAGSVSQIRECTAELQRYAKETLTPVILIGHITKDGSIAGPKVLEHMVDTVLQFEGDRHHIYRILRTVKNRFGSTSEIGIYEMKGDGLRQVTNPSEILISQREEHQSGVSIAAAVEGLRPLLIETQALVTKSVYGTPQRTTNGFDLRRLSMLLAVAEKRMGIHLASQDVFLNIAGGIRVEDPAMDLSVVAALLSSYHDVAIAGRCCFAAEIGLSGEVRAVTRLEQRISEADRLGFETIYLSRYGAKGLNTRNLNISLKTLQRVQELPGMLY